MSPDFRPWVPGTQWDLDLYGPGDLVRLDSIGFSQPVAQRYTGIELRND